MPKTSVERVIVETHGGKRQAPEERMRIRETKYLASVISLLCERCVYIKL